MDTAIAAVARECLASTYDGSLNFPAVISMLENVGFEGYTVDYRSGIQTLYLPEGGTLDLPLPHPAGPVAAQFDIAAMKALIRWAEGDPAYTDASFSQKITGAGCVGYLVSFPGRRVVYYGRTGETHTEFFPQ